MALGEFELIQHYFADLTAQVNYSPLVLGIGDDCALLAPDPAHWTAVSTDTLVAGVHFPENTPAADIGWKALAVNLSDLAAMGATPSWFNLALTLPAADSEWLRQFCDGMAQLIQLFPIKLIGGDTTRGPLSITITVAGQLPAGKALLRSGAKDGDSVFVSGYLGDAGRGLQLWQLNNASHPVEHHLIQRLLRPQPRLTLGSSLLTLANSCIDISDGLFGDLKHICERSAVQAQIDAALLPLSADLLNDLEPAQAIKLALTAGDDYELCFTAAAEHEVAIFKLSDALGVPVTKIGQLFACDDLTQPGITILNYSASESESAFQHFKANA